MTKYGGTCPKCKSFYMAGSICPEHGVPLVELTCTNHHPVNAYMKYCRHCGVDVEEDVRVDMGNALLSVYQAEDDYESYHMSLY